MRRRVSPFRAGLGRRCPGCGEGRLYVGFLKVGETCGRCGLDLRDHDAGDGPAVFVILIVGFLVVAAALVTEVRYAPPVWLHLAVWIPLILISSLGLLPTVKSLLIALRYRHRAGERPPAGP